MRVELTWRKVRRQFEHGIATEFDRTVKAIGGGEWTAGFVRLGTH